MPRIGALLSLSREHHSSLVMARDAKRAAHDNDEAACSAAIIRVENHWQSLMAAHFEQEERLIGFATGRLDPEAVARVLADHAELRTLASGPCSLEPAARLSRFAELTVAHVRYEERIFFPQLASHPCVAAASTEAANSVQSSPER